MPKREQQGWRGRGVFCGGAAVLLRGLQPAGDPCWSTGQEREGAAGRNCGALTPASRVAPGLAEGTDRNLWKQQGGQERALEWKLGMGQERRLR